MIESKVTKSQEEIYNDLKALQDTHSFALHPVLGKTDMSLEKWSKLIYKIKRCPCDPSRKSCPCSKAADEVRSQGHCCCRLFWNDKCEEYKNWGKNGSTKKKKKKKKNK